VTTRQSATVLWINHFAVPPSQGGGTRHFELGRELTRLGWRVNIAASDFNLQSRQYTRRPGPAARESVLERIDGVEFLWLWASAYDKNDWRRVRNWVTFAGSILRQRTEFTPSVVIGSSPHLFAALAASRLATQFGVPFVLEVRDLWPESMIAAGGRKGPVYQVFDRIARHLYARADRIVVLARGSADRIAELGFPRDKIVYVPNGVDVSAFECVQSQSRQAGAPFTLVYAGAHGPANGLDVVLDAAELLRERTDLNFVLVGDGPVKEALCRSAEQRRLTNVEFRPPVAKREMPALLAACDAGLMVLRDSPLFAFGVSPNKLFDYLGAALPVVCNVPGDVAGMLAEARAGVQTRDAGARALADAAVAMAERTPAEREAMGRSGRTWVAREHGRPVLAARLDTMLREIVAA
jgi:glycosyltransferase involved in cell wall biosynthesis